tara:strand:+ start:986 stop:1138 length:153 start_codon:yes stop_codon:yes gene_type:complete
MLENINFLYVNVGSKYTNEYQFATVLSDLVGDAVVGKSVKLLREYGLKVF